jgi:pyrroline-5-carboxylate reductase
VIATAMFLSSAKLVAASKDTPWELIDKVYSPGGIYY